MFSNKKTNPSQHRQGIDQYIELLLKLLLQQNLLVSYLLELSQ